MASTEDETLSRKLADSPGEDIRSPTTDKVGLCVGEKRKADVLVKKPFMSVKLGGTTPKPVSGISMKISSKGSDNKAQKLETKLFPKKGIVAQAFNDDESDEEEEMPKEAKMRMRNIGKDTPTSAGPNSFNKGKEGFTDHKKVWEKNMKLKPTEVQKTPEEKINKT